MFNVLCKLIRDRCSLQQFVVTVYITPTTASSAGAFEVILTQLWLKVSPKPIGETC